MKISNIGLIAIGTIAMGAVALGTMKNDIKEFVSSLDESDSVKVDSIPTSQYYQSTIVISHGGKSDLGSNPLVNHQVPCDYEGNDNNWDEELSKIK